MRKIPPEYENPIDNIMYDISEYVSPTFHKYGFTPNIVTTLSNISTIITIILLLKAKYIWAALFVSIAYFFDCLDGHLARKYKQYSDWGDYYDHISDIIKSLSIAITLFYINSSKFYKIAPVIIIAFLLSFIQLGCQEKYSNYNSKSNSELLTITKNFCPANDKESLEKTMIYTRYLGTGTPNLIAVLSILYYNF